MTSFSENDINRDCTGKFAAKSTSETDASALEGHDETPSGVNMSYAKNKPFTPKVGQRVAVITRSGFGRETVSSVTHATITKVGKRDVHAEYGNGNSVMFRMNGANYSGGYELANTGSRYHSGPMIYPSDHPVTHNAEVDRRISSARTTLRNNAESFDVAVRQHEFDSARSIHAEMGRQLDEIEAARSQRITW